MAHFVEYCECGAEVNIEVAVTREGSRVLWELESITRDCDCDTRTDWEWARDAVENRDESWDPRD